jgi:hypothetical protein
VICEVRLASDLFIIVVDVTLVSDSILAHYSILEIPWDMDINCNSSILWQLLPLLYVSADLIRVEKSLLGALAGTAIIKWLQLTLRILYYTLINNKFLGIESKWIR